MVPGNIQRRVPSCPSTRHRSRRTPFVTIGSTRRLPRSRTPSRQCAATARSQRTRSTHRIASPPLTSRPDRQHRDRRHEEAVGSAQFRPRVDDNPDDNGDDGCCLTTAPARPFGARRDWSRSLRAPGSVAVTWSWLTASPIPQDTPLAAKDERKTWRCAPHTAGNERIQLCEDRRLVPKAETTCRPEPW